MTDVLVAVAALVLMEPVTALAHRFVMHGFGMGWHRSHHESPRTVLEANDLFPVVFAGVTIVILAIGVYCDERAAAARPHRHRRHRVRRRLPARPRRRDPSPTGILAAPGRPAPPLA